MEVSCCRNIENMRHRNHLLPPPPHSKNPLQGSQSRLTIFLLSALFLILKNPENRGIAEDFRVKGIWGEDAVWQHTRNGVAAVGRSWCVGKECYVGGGEEDRGQQLV